MKGENIYTNFEDVMKATLLKGHKFTAARFEAERCKISVPSYSEQKMMAENYAESVGKIINADNKLADKKQEEVVNVNALNEKNSGSGEMVEDEKTAKRKKSEDELLDAYAEMIAKIDAEANARKAKVLERIDRVNKRIRAKREKNLDRNAYLGEMFFEVYRTQLGETHESMKAFVLSLCKDDVTKESVNAVQFFDRRNFKDAKNPKNSKGRKKAVSENDNA